MQDYADNTQEKYQEVYEKNLNYFENFHHEIYLKLINFNKEEKYSLFLQEYQVESNFILLPNVEILDIKTAAYQDNPIKQGEYLASNSLENDHWLQFNHENKTDIKDVNKAIFVSNGLGYHFEKYNKKFDLKSIIIIEEDLEIFRLSTFIVDYKELSNDKQIMFSIEDNSTVLRNKLLRFYYSLFFYNNSIKIVELFHSDVIKEVLEIYQTNINTDIYSSKLNYQEMLTDKEFIVMEENFYSEFDDIRKNVNINSPFQQDKVFTIIQLLITLVTMPISLKEYIKITNKLYYYIYFISCSMDEVFIQFKDNAYFYLKCMEDANLLDKEIYTDMITISYVVAEFDTSIDFSERFIKYLEKENNSKDKELLLSTIYQLKALKGETIDKSSQDYIKLEFNNFAKSFEDTLVNTLEYKIPKIIVETLLPYLSLNTKYDILDLGCGTGLLGEAIKDISKSIDGIDLSTQMIKIAKEKKIYANLIESDIQEYLVTQKNNQYDIVTSADVFVYMGDLIDLFRDTKKILKEKGLFVFSIELSNSDDYKLNQSGRFAHSLQYIKSLSNRYGFSILNTTEVQLRLEGDKYLKGIVFILKT